MRISLYGGFGEKGRTCIGVERASYRLLLDAGVKTSARGRGDYVPAISRDELATFDAMIVTHAHEDHVGALGWCLANGFNGRILMTAPTQHECGDIVAAYGSANEARLVRDARIEALDTASQTTLGPFRVTAGRSGHVVGGVWCAIDDGATRFGYCGDVVSRSPVFAMDPLPVCDALAIDASYGDDNVTLAQRAREIAAWVAARGQGCVLPTPLYGRSLELFALLPQVALAPGMREALHAQIDAGVWLVDHAGDALRARLAQANDYRIGDRWPREPVLCHDGMGMSGPSQQLLATASETAHPVLFTGHVPDGSPGHHLLEAGRADWIRLPTHPTRDENVALARASGARVVLGHSCDSAALARLAAYIPALRADAATGDHVDIG
jgi:hypothetical protein